MSSIITAKTCSCGAKGSITLERPSAADGPGPLAVERIVKIEGPFKVDSEGNLRCLECGTSTA